ncbi:MAG: aromatic ring-opening dioxygenase LigA, partial [Micrococcaceae bacterium]|nr:aromatic ring-opening dioxygenase LigA [Micrococcaceae bacterium]
TVMTASFLRASLFTSVLAFGVAALVIGLGILFALIGWALLSIRPAHATVRDESVVA